MRGRLAGRAPRVDGVSDLSTMLAPVAVSLGGAGALGQAVRAIYRDLRADRLAADAVAQARLDSRDARIHALEAELAADKSAHRDTTERLLINAMEREHQVVTALLAISELPDAIRDGLDALGRSLDAVLSHLRLEPRDSRPDDAPAPPSRKGGR